ncbi:MAG: anaerobic ribonucleoside-triphosphate reductase, partial [Eubacteriales bacterium]
ATPAESTSYRLAKHDKEAYPDIITAGTSGAPYYTNSSHLPVGYTSDIFEALDIQDELQTLYTSGTVFHAFLGEKLPDWKAAANLVRKIAENYKLPYYTLSPTYSICKKHGYLPGEQYECPECGEKTEVYSRITGYYRPVQNWNSGKAQEFRERRLYEVDVHSPAGTDSSTAIPAPALAESPAVSLADGIYLIATTTCPNCRAAEARLVKNGISYQKMLAEDHADLCVSLGITRAPTLLVAENGEVTEYGNLSEILKFCERG